MTAPPDDRRLLAWTVGLGALALLWRLRLAGLYYGSEEEDYGNLGLILGTLDSGFRYVETEHMPLFTALAAAVTAAVGDAELGGEVVAVLSGVAAVALTLRLGWRWLSPAAGVAAAAALVVQPDLALYSATPLRISTYVAFVLAAVLALGERRTALAAFALSLGFLTRFDLAFSILPAAALLAAGRSRSERDHRTWIPVVVAGLTVVAWSAWYHHEEGTFRFWGGVAERNENAEPGLVTVLGFLRHIVPAHLGRIAALASLVGAALMLRGRAARPAEARWLLLAGASAVGLLTTTLFLSSYDWNHNLYWKWFSTSIPFLLLGAAHAGVEAWKALAGRRPLAVALLVLAVADTGWCYQHETRAQLARSDQWYGTQVRLMDWIEAEFPDDVGVLADLIPATYLSRQHSPRRVFLWRQSELPPADEAAFAAFVRANRVSIVFWFAEAWVGADEAAPWLAEPEPKIVGGVRMLPIAAEPGYGFVAWQVLEPGLPDAAHPPPIDAGATPHVRARVVR